MPETEDYRLPENTAEAVSRRRLDAAKAMLGRNMSFSTASSDISDAQRESYAISSKVRGKQDKQ